MMHGCALGLQSWPVAREFSMHIKILSRESFTVRTGPWSSSILGEIRTGATNSDQLARCRAAHRIPILSILGRRSFRFHHYGGATPAPFFQISHQHLRKGSLQCRRDHVCCRTLAQTKPVLDAVAAPVIGDADSMCRSCLHAIFPNRRHHRR